MLQFLEQSLGVILVHSSKTLWPILFCFFFSLKYHKLLLRIFLSIPTFECNFLFLWLLEKFSFVWNEIKIFAFLLWFIFYYFSKLFMYEIHYFLLKNFFKLFFLLLNKNNVTKYINIIWILRKDALLIVFYKNSNSLLKLLRNFIL